MAFMVDDNITSIIQRMPDEPVPLLTNVSETYLRNIINKPLAGFIALHHVIFAASKQRSKMALCRVLEHTLRCDNDCALDDTFLHTLVTHLIGMQDEFHSEDFCITVFDDFFMVSWWSFVSFTVCLTCQGPRQDRIVKRCFSALKGQFSLL